MALEGIQGIYPRCLKLRQSLVQVVHSLHNVYTKQTNVHVHVHANIIYGELDEFEDDSLRQQVGRLPPLPVHMFVHPPFYHMQRTSSTHTELLLCCSTLEWNKR